MLLNSDTVYFIIWAAVIGIAFAIVYTNLQRDALSKFITALIEKKADSEKSALTLQELNVTGFASFIVRGAVKSQNGLKKAVKVFEICDKKAKDEAELLISGNKSQYRYCLFDGVDTVLLLKKYSFKKLALWQIVAVLASVIVTAVIATKAVDILDSFASSKSEEQQEEEQENQNTGSDSSETEKQQDTIVLPEEDFKDKTPVISPSEKSDNGDEDNSNVSRPSIPMLPTAQ